MCMNKTVILDEAEYGIVNYAATFDAPDIAPLGMVSLKFAKQVYFLSATYDAFSLQFMKLCFQMKENQFLRFKSASEIVHNISDDKVDKPMQQVFTEPELENQIAAII